MVSQNGFMSRLSHTPQKKKKKKFVPPGPVVTGKLRPPRLRQILPRPRLLEMAGLESRPKLVTICAGAGYGKTTMMAQLAESLPYRWMWYQLDDLDHDPAIFIRHLITGVQLSLEGAGERSLERLEGVTDLKQEGKYVLRVLTDEIGEHLRDGFSIFFDDFHVFEEAPFAKGFIDCLVKHLPPGASVILASRRKPKLNLMPLRSKRSIRDIGRQDLQLSRSEFKQLVESTWNYAIPEGSMKQIYDHTEGWVTGLVLLENYLKSNRELPELFTKGKKIRRHVYEYLAEEVLNRYSYLRQLLLKCSLIDPIDAAICDESMGIDDSVKLLAQAASLNLFVTDLGGGRFYRFHPLFREFLLARIGEELSNEELNRLRLRFGKAFERAGETKKAVEQYLAGGFFQQAGSCIEPIWKRMINEGQFETLDRWTGQLPPERLTAVLMICRGEAIMYQGKIEQALEIFQTAKKLIRPDQIDERCRCAISTCFCLTSLSMITEGRKELENLMPLKMNSRSRFDLLFRLASSYWEESEMEKLASCLKEAEFLVSQHSFLLETGQMNMMKAAMSICYGNFKKAHTLYLNVLSAPKINARNQNIASVNLAHCLMMIGEYQTALEIVTDCRKTVQQQKSIQFLPALLETLGGILMAMGQEKAGEKEILNAVGIDFGLRKTFSESQAFALCHLGTYARRLQNIDQAIDFHNRSLEIQTDIGKGKRTFEYLRIANQTNLAADFLRKQDTEKANELLSESFKTASPSNFSYFVMQIHFHRAWGAYLKGDEEEQIMNLRRALKIAKEHQQNHFLIQEGKISLPLFTLALANEIESKYVSWILARIGPVSLTAIEPLLVHDNPNVRINAADLIGKIGDPNGIALLRRILRDDDRRVINAAKSSLRSLRDKLEKPDELLTGRERQVLAILATGASNGQIAKQLFISDQTVKTHVNKIFRKLGLTNRWEAALYFQSMERKNTTFEEEKIQPKFDYKELLN